MNKSLKFQSGLAGYVLHSAVGMTLGLLTATAIPQYIDDYRTTTEALAMPVEDEEGIRGSDAGVHACFPRAHALVAYILPSFASAFHRHWTNAVPSEAGVGYIDQLLLQERHRP